MKKTTPLKVLNPILAVLALIQFGTVIIAWLFPAIYTFGVHRISGIALGLVILAHIFLNRAWIKANYFKKKTGSVD